MFSPDRKSLKENKSEERKFIASETGKRNRQAKSHADVPQTRERNKRCRKEEMRVTYWLFGKFQKGGKS